MTDAELEREIKRGKGLFAEIIRVTSDFLEGFDALSPFELRAFEEKRQRQLKELLAFQSGLKEGLAGREEELPLAVAKQYEEFRIFQEVFVQIIMEKNATIISRATQSRDRLRRELAVIGRGKQALRGYNRRKGVSRNCLDQTA